MGIDLSKVAARQNLKHQREPHWQRLRQGCFLGYRASKAGGTGTWIARAYDPETKKNKQKALGDFGNLAGNAMFAAAKKEAEAFAEIVATGGVQSQQLQTVADACREYAKYHPEAQGRFCRFVYKDHISHVRLDRLRKRHLVDWRARLTATPALVSRGKKGAKKTRTRAASTINRDMVPMRAALSSVLAPGTPGTDAAWQEALRPTPGAGQQRTLYIDKEQRRRMLENTPEDARAFLHALCLLPCRPGALAAANVGHFDHRTSELSIGKDKNGKARRIRVPRAAAALLAKQAVGKRPDDPLIGRANGKRWDRNSWKVPISIAAANSDLRIGVTAYTLRHSIITDLVQEGLPLLSIAQISGASIEMIERHYGHLVGDGVVQALESLEI